MTTADQTIREKVAKASKAAFAKYNTQLRACE